MPAITKTNTILLAGLTAGALDITGALIVYPFVLKVTTPQKVLQSVAAGIYGKDAYTGGTTTATAGLLFHFCIAMIFAAFYVVILYNGFNKIVKSAFIKGLLYGCAVWAVMNLIIVPNSAANRPFSFDWTFFLWGIGLIIFCVGMPIAYITQQRPGR